MALLWAEQDELVRKVQKEIKDLSAELQDALKYFATHHRELAAAAAV